MRTVKFYLQLQKNSISQCKKNTFTKNNLLLRKKFILLQKNIVSMEKEKTANVIQKITTLRSKKGYTYENMAHELDITPASYRKIEIGETKLTVERLFKIAEILKESVSNLLEVDGNVFNQTNNENSGNQYQQKIENFYHENKEVYEKLLKSKDEQIELLKSMVGK